VIINEPVYSGLVLWKTVSYRPATYDHCLRGDRRRAVAEPFSDRYHVDASGDEGRCGTMAQCMEHDPQQAERADYAPSITAERVAWIGRAIRPCEHQIIVGKRKHRYSYDLMRSCTKRNEIPLRWCSTRSLTLSYGKECYA